jgi:exonuclease III
LISDLAKTNDNTNWLIFGDFNIVINSFEKAGGNPIDYNIAEAFRDCLESCNLKDLGYKGDPYTWHNRQQDNHYIQPRLDRFCASTNWSYNFFYYQNMHLLRYGSDHCLILLDFSTSP